MAFTGDHFIHRTIDGDRWDLLAHHYYGDASKQTVLLAANKGLYLNPIRVPDMILSAGLTLIIPIIDDDRSTTDENSLPPWKRKNPDYGAAT